MKVIASLSMFISESRLCTLATKINLDKIDFHNYCSISHSIFLKSSITTMLIIVLRPTTTN